MINGSPCIIRLVDKAYKGLKEYLKGLGILLKGGGVI
jgi:hypothetical protein